MNNQAQARDVAELLKRSHQRLVLAESCTAGQIAASLGQIAGISEHFCGSAVVYRQRTKQQWLGVSPDELRRHTAVSLEVTRTLARQVLQNTEEATVAMAVTGHLGPDAPLDQDGDVHVVICKRTAAALQQISEITERLPPGDRVQRQAAAADVALRNLREVLATLLADAGREPL